MTALDGAPGATLSPSTLSASARRLYEAAVELFCERGGLSTTVKDIASACNLTQGALYNHFASKDHLLYLIVSQTHRVLESEVARAHDLATTPTDRLKAIVRVYVAFHARHPREAKIANLEFRRLPAPWSEEIVRTRRRMREHLTRVLRAGQKSGEFRLPSGGTDVAAAVIATTILDMCIQITSWFHQDHPWAISDLQVYFQEVAFRIVKGEHVSEVLAASGSRPIGSSDMTT